jgi:hypothetical protein
MNRKKRNEFYNSSLSLETRLENKYTGKVQKLIRKQISSFKSKVRSEGLPRAVAWLQHQVYDPAISVVLQKMYLESVFAFGILQYKHANQLAKAPVKKESAAFSFSESWNFSIIDFLSQHLLERAVVPVTDTTRKLIMDVLEKGQENGWGVERIITELATVDEMSAFRARRIVRTELGIAANFGTNLAASEVEFETQEEWITAHDHRVRSSHAVMDGVIINTGETFTVPVYKGKKDTGIKEQMTGPGDPTASAGNVINCRCTRAIVPKRDENDELIMKPTKHLLTPTNKRIHV